MPESHAGQGDQVGDNRASDSRPGFLPVHMEPAGSMLRGADGRPVQAAATPPQPLPSAAGDQQLRPGTRRNVHEGG